MLDDDAIKAGEGYFLFHGIGYYPEKEAEITAELAAFAASWSAVDDGQWDYIYACTSEFIDLWRALIGAGEGSIATTENVTAACYSLFGAVPPEQLAGRKILVAGDCFPSNHFLLSAMAARRGFTLETVPLRQGDGHVRDEDFIAHWDDDVAVALITWVSSTSSHRVDLEALVAHGRKQGSIIGVDITQGAGVVPFDVGAPVVDFAITTSLKWMCGVPGAGILYVRPELIGEFEPEFRGWFSQPDPFNWDFDKFSYAPDARRFDHGTPSPLPLVGSLPGLCWHAAVGIERIARHNRALVDRMFAAGEAGKWDIVTPPAVENRGGSIMVRLPAGTDPKTLQAALKARGVLADFRGQILRLSPGLVTSQAAVDVAIATIDRVF